MNGERFASRPQFGAKAYQAVFFIFAIPWGLSLWFLFLCEWLGFPLPQGTDKRMVWVVLLVFLPIQITVVRGLLDKRDRIVADASGLLYRPWSDQVIPWSAVRRATLNTAGMQDFVGLWLSEPQRYPSRGLKSWLSWRSKYGDVPIHVPSTGVTTEQLLAVIERFRPGIYDPKD